MSVRVNFLQSVVAIVVYLYLEKMCLLTTFGCRDLSCLVCVSGMR